MKLTRTIAFRLFLVIVSVQTIILFAFTFAAVQIQQSHIMENVVMGATRVSDLIARSTRHSMLLNQKDDVRNIIASVGGEPGLEGIRIYNKQGEVIFGSIPDEAHTQVDVNAEACVSCHSSTHLDSISQTTAQLTRVFSKPNGDRVLGLITPIRNERQCSDAACHAHPESKTILGVLDVKMSLAQVDVHLQQSRNQLLLLSSGAVLLISLISGGFIWIVINRPVKRLMRGMQLVSSGQLDQKLETTSSDEFGKLAVTFNRMTEDLVTAREELTGWSRTLEQKVEEKTADLERAHKHMVTVEKMASLGNLAATVAHELNNPLEGILTFARLLMKKVKRSTLGEKELQQMHDELKLIADESLRCGNIVKNLLVFARHRGGSFGVVSLKTVVDRCVMLMSHHARMHEIELNISCPDNIVMDGDSNQLQQALIALISNAIEAMDSPGRTSAGHLKIEVLQQAPDKVRLCVSDTGCGMSDDVKAHIFEPFFTTKSEGKGVGLGLAVVYGIVQHHHGTILADSTPGAGTTFTLTFPIKQEMDASQPGVSGIRKEMNHEQQ
ncbi:MAG: sensor histidine kinase [Bacteroidota bacterium]